MIHDVVEAVYRGGYRIEVVFDNGRSGVVDFSPYLERGGIFERFHDMKFFRKFEINTELGVLTWGDEVDVAPGTLYVEATGEPLPAWMTPEPALTEHES
ncbi:MAG TPA: DUF2442 domain-containing protein [Candidatus Hydrogenedentes bacterium]|nr:DUF2442 domain-containing protein [Candidatus Hydrogenedentota bacterium]